MNWQDTVMTPFQLQFYHGKPKEVKQKVAQDQAEISFKAGAMKVMEWVEKHSEVLDWQGGAGLMREFNEQEWQSFVKELGVT